MRTSVFGLALIATLVGCGGPSATKQDTKARVTNTAPKSVRPPVVATQAPTKTVSADGETYYCSRFVIGAIEDREDTSDEKKARYRLAQKALLRDYPQKKIPANQWDAYDATFERVDWLRKESNRAVDKYNAALEDKCSKS